MKNRLTRKLLLIVAIPLTFELVLFSVCALMLNLAELERVNESRSISAVSMLCPTLVSTVRNVTLIMNSVVTGEPPDRLRYEKDRENAARQLDKIESISTEHKEYQKEIGALTENVRVLNAFVDKLATDSTSLDLASMLKLKDCAEGIDQSASSILNSLKEKRSELRKNDLFVRRFFRGLLWSSVAISLIISVVGILAFYRLLFRPLRELADLSDKLAQGKIVEPSYKDDDEIGDLNRSFEEMAYAIEKNRRIEKSIFQNSGDIICAINLDNRIDLINKAVENILGYKSENLINVSVLEILPEVERQSVLRHLEQIRSRKSLGSFESSLLSSNGTTVDVVWSVRWSEREKVLECCLYNVDFEKRTERLGKGFRAIVADDLKSTLVAARARLSSLDKENLSESKKISNLEADLGRIVNLLDSLGEAISSQSTELSLSISTVSARALVDNSLNAVNSLASEKTLEIVSQVDEVSLEVDQSQVQRVLINLLSNAIKASPDSGTIFVKVQNSRQSHRSKESTLVHFEVSDQGPGIPLNKQHMLFESFSQVEKLQSREGKGSGLGLYGSRKIVEGHSGRIGVISDGTAAPSDTTGTTMWFDLPVART